MYRYLFLCLPTNFTVCLYEIIEWVKKALERRFTINAREELQNLNSNKILFYFTW